VTPDDESQAPVEHFAELLLHHARQDTRLAQRTAANDDDMHSRIQALAAMHRQWEPALLLPSRLGIADAESMEALESLVSAALTSAQDAEALSQQAYDTSRRARRGMMVGLALAMLGTVVAVAGTMGGRLFDAQDNTSHLANQMQALSTLQHHISDQLAALQVQNPVRENGVKSTAQLASAVTRAPAPEVNPGRIVLPPLTTTQVGILPAHMAVQDDAEDGKPRTGARQASPVAYVSPGVVADPAPSQGYPPTEWRQPVYSPLRPVYQLVTWPAFYVIRTVNRDARVLLR